MSWPCLPGMRETPSLPAASTSARTRRDCGASGASSAASTASRSSRSGRRISATAGALAPRICTHSAGSLDAMRVVSRRPCPVSPSAARRPVAQPRREQRGDELRRVGDQRDAAIVIVGVHLDRHGAEVEDHVLDRGGALVGDAVVAGDDPGPADEQVGARRDRSPALAPGHRVRAEVAREVGAAGSQVVERRDLDARDIGDQRIRDTAASSAATTSAVDVGRHGDDDQAGRVVGRGRAAGAVGDRQVAGRRRRVLEDHVDAVPAQAEADAGAEEAAADDAHLLRESAVVHSGRSSGSSDRAASRRARRGRWSAIGRVPP